MKSFGLAENTGLRSPQICCPVFSLLDPRTNTHQPVLFLTSILVQGSSLVKIALD